MLVRCGPLVARLAVAALLVLASGCAWDGPMSTVVRGSDFNRAILRVYTIITWATGIIGLVVFVVLGYILMRFRRPPDTRLPAQIRGNTLLELGWTIMPAIVLLVIAIPTIQIIFRTQTQGAPAGALRVTVRAWQWWWEFRYPDLDVVTANELHLPVGRSVVLELEGPDVIHSFWVPHLGGKRDVVPGRHNRIVLTPETPGLHWGQCAEFCGASHANMGMRVLVQPAAEFDAWVAGQKATPPEPTGAAADGQAIFAKSACVGCHTIAGVSAGVLAPNLTHYGVSAFVFFLIGGIEALIIRLQLVRPYNTLVDAPTYNALFTMHGTTMIFLAIMPLNAAFFNYMIPLMIGARDVAFPRLNALSYWIFLAGGLFLNLSWLVGTPPDGGWFGYANLTTRQFSPGLSIDFWMLSLQVLGASSVIAAINFIVTVLNMRAPGMTLMRMPLFVWMSLVVQFLIVLAFPPVTVGLIFLMFDRFFGTHFFDVAAGGDLHLWQHLFWIFGHPEVYILILPAFGIVSEVLPTFARKPLFAAPVVIYSGALIGFFGFGVWGHHMFAAGMGPVADAAFSIATMLIAIPTGVKIFNWLATLWGGAIRTTTALHFAVGL